MNDWEFKENLIQLRGMLDHAGVPWAIAAGAAVYLYARSRPPTDLDVLVRPEDLTLVGKAMQTAPTAETTAWGEAEKIELDSVEVSGKLVVDVGDQRYPYWMDGDMVGRVRCLDFDGVEIPVLAPEDIVAFKAVLQRGPEQGKHDLEDIEALASTVELDTDYLWRRLRAMGAEDRARTVLAT